MSHFTFAPRIASTFGIATCGALVVGCSGSGMADDSGYDEFGGEPAVETEASQPMTTYEAAVDSAVDSEPTTVEALGRDRQLSNSDDASNLSGTVRDAALSGGLAGAWVCLGGSDDERCDMTDLDGSYAISGASFDMGAAVTIERSGFLPTRQASAPVLGGAFSRTYLVHEDDVDGGLEEGTGAVLIKLHRMMDMIDWTPMQGAQVEVSDYDVLYASSNARFELSEGTGDRGFALVADVEAGELSLTSENVAGATCSFFDGNVFSDSLDVDVQAGAITLVYANCE